MWRKKRFDLIDMLMLFIGCQIGACIVYWLL